jgi:hypothetical protein
LAHFLLHWRAWPGCVETLFFRGCAGLGQLKRGLPTRAHAWLCSACLPVSDFTFALLAGPRASYDAAAAHGGAACGNAARSVLKYVACDVLGLFTRGQPMKEWARQQHWALCSLLSCVVAVLRNPWLSGCSRAPTCIVAFLSIYSCQCCAPATTPNYKLGNFLCTRGCSVLVTGPRRINLHSLQVSMP